jgi:RimJ/RimL family protein N-acetyltransferase
MIRWAVQPLHHGQAIGTVGLLRVNHEHRRSELGYDLARYWWGQGLATEATAAVVASCRFFSLLATDTQQPGMHEVMGSFEAFATVGCPVKSTGLRWHARKSHF